MAEHYWQKYRSVGPEGIEYWVECDRDTGEPVEHDFHGERCFQIKTIRNYKLKEQVHQPATTMMPAACFPDRYMRVSA